jgi:hypothetical protein
MDDFGVPRDGVFDWEGGEDLTTLSRQGLSSKLESLREDRRALDYRRQVLQGRIDLILTELAGRGTAALPPEELARVLLGEVHARGAAIDSATDPARDMP